MIYARHVMKTIEFFFDQELTMAEAEKLAQSIGSREELLAWILLKRSPELKSQLFFDVIKEAANEIHDREFEYPVGEAEHQREQAAEALEETLTQEVLNHLPGASEYALTAMARYVTRSNGSVNIVDIATKR